jgi:hypothetical protein
MSIYYFRNNKHTFKAIVNSSEMLGKKYHSIIIGGIYKDCINMSIKIGELGHVELATIPHLESFPDCNLENFSEKGDTVDMIRAAIQFIAYLFPAVKYITFEDASNIDCGITKNRKHEKPFSLAYLYLSQYGKTWYEYHFNATLTNKVFYNLYREETKNLFDKTKLDTSLLYVYTNSEQKDMIAPYLLDISGKSWIDFFNSIPISKRCSIFFNWLGQLIDKIINNSYTPRGWVINIDEMPKTEFSLLDGPPTQKGGRRRTRKSKNQTYFSNQHVFSHGFFSGE